MGLVVHLYRQCCQGKLTELGPGQGVNVMKFLLLWSVDACQRWETGQCCILTLHHSQCVGFHRKQ